MLIGDILRASARNHGRKAALIDGQSSVTYAELNARCNQLAHALRRLGLVQGERVAVLLPNGHQFVETFFAVAKAGLVVVPINTGLSVSEVALIVKSCGAKACIFGADSAGVVAGLAAAGAPIATLITTGNSQPALSYEELLQAEPVAEPDHAISPDDLAMIMFTSGSTSAPKGVMSTHRNIVSNTNTMTHELRIVPEDVTLVFMPMFHNGGLWPLLTHFYRSATVTVQPRFKEADVLAAIAAQRVSVLNVVPTMLARLIEHPDFAKSDLSSLRLVMHGGGPITPDALKVAMQALGPQRIYTSLGSTEANGMLTSYPTHEHALEGPLAEKLRSVGREAIGVEVRIVDDAGVERPMGQVGEIIARGANIAPGYWNDPEETAASFRNGWLHVGDMGYRDADGFIFISGRKKDIIISGGENVSSLEVEQALARHPSVRDAAVFGVPDNRWGEAVVALVNLRPDAPSDIDEKALIAFCADQLAPFKRPKSVRFVGEFPKTALGKVAKGELRKLFIASS